MSDIYDQSYNNPYHINRHSLGDQYRINLQNAPQNTSWFTGGSPSHNQRNGSILRDNGRFVIPSTYNQPRSQSYNKYNSKISETEYNSEYVPYILGTRFKRDGSKKYCGSSEKFDDFFISQLLLL